MICLGYQECWGSWSVVDRVPAWLENFQKQVGWGSWLVCWKRSICYVPSVMLPMVIGYIAWLCSVGYDPTAVMILVLFHLICSGYVSFIFHLFWSFNLNLYITPQPQDLYQSKCKGQRVIDFFVDNSERQSNCFIILQIQISLNCFTMKNLVVL